MWEFVWDKAKANSNLKTHRISFEEAKTVFYDCYARLKNDPDHSEGESRFVLLGMSDRRRMLVVCHCDRENETIVRIISAGRATKREQSIYEEYLL
jgi:uncharacterized DUF497 family protein